MTNQIDQTTLQSLGLAAPGTHGARERVNDRLGQEDFLRLMVTQLSNQDPFKPMESGEFLGQLAQFGTVSGISDMQKSLATLAGALQGNQTLKAAALIDRDVLVPSREAWLPPTGAVRGALDIPSGVANVSLEVLDLAGGLLGRVPVQVDAHGRGSFSWDGTLPGGSKAEPGFYSLRATGQRQGQSEALGVMVYGRVESVGVGSSGSSLSLTVTGLGEIDFSRVKGIAQAAASAS